MLDGEHATEDRVSLRRRLAAFRFSSARIRTKLAFMLLIPVLALAGISAVRLTDSAQEAADADRTSSLVRLTETVSGVIRAMQDERAQAAVQVYKTTLDDVSVNGFDDAVLASDERLNALAAARRAFGPGTAVGELLASADRPLSRLGIVRAAAHGDIEVVHLTVYNAAVTRLTAVLNYVVDQAEAPSLNQSLRAAALLGVADESSELLRVETLGLRDGEPLDAAYRELMELIGDRQRALDEYRRISGGAGAGGFDAGGLGGADARPANSFEREVATTRSNEPIEIDHAELTAAFNARHAATTTAIQGILAATVTSAEAIQSSVTNQVLIEVTVVVVTLILAVITALWLGRSVTRGLRRLRDSARRVAADELPTAVRQVDEHQDLTGLTPEEFADATTPPLEDRGTDELAEVAESFNLVHREAIRVAAQQAMLRVHIGSMFVRLARRGHSLTGRLTAELDAAELEEQDPDQLERLFRLDHLVSLQGRANDSLLVLGGSSAAKVRTSNERLGDVLRAAQSHTEHYTRVNFTVVDEGVWIKPAAVDDTVQLLAELIDNATKYSSEPALIAARFLSDKVVVEIRDRGIGIDDDRLDALNERLARTGGLDLESLQAMGLTVVALIAARNGVDVRLRAAPDRGIIAEVVLPAAMLDFEPTPHDERRGPAAITAGASPVRREAPLFRSRDRSGTKTAPAPEPGRVGEQPTELIPVVHFAWRDNGDAPAGPPALPAAPAAGPYAEPPATPDGLPRRRPMSNLVPEAGPHRSEEPVRGPIRRDPAAIGATYLAYARGLTGSRSNQNPPNNNPRNAT